MRLNVKGQTLYSYTGGKSFDAARPTVVFVHGVLNDHSVWGLQSRYFANHGWNVLAIDLPGHCRSGGEPARSVEDAAEVIIALLDAAGVKQAALVGHSFGSLAVLEAAGRAPERVSHLALVATASPMKVSPALIEASLNQPQEAIRMVNVFSHSTLAPPPSALGPGTWVHGASQALMRRVLASNSQVNVFHAGFKACDDYKGGEAAMRRVSCPVLFVLGRDDAMTPPRSAQALQAVAPDSRTVLLEGGHSLMTEAPDGVLFALKELLES
ncbi:MAG TPA: alpha/beta hydrolase [Ramlibacter sp.]|nr:alpha/beta hydrolase [Ramlibacter sp.]